MKSPFPGMDPYLERYWLDVHASLVPYARDLLRTQLPRDLRARIEERVYIQSLTGRTQELRPDVYVIEWPRSRRRAAGRAPRAAGNGAVAVAEPIVVDTGDEAVSELFIEIRTAKDDRNVITTIEFVSPTNKVSGPGRDSYVKKQQSALAAGVNLVEIDLVRTGRHVVAVPIINIPEEEKKDYLICVRRADRKLKAGIYPVSIRERLPRIRIPLRPGDREPILDLQLLLNRVYRQGDYSDIDYTKDPEPPLDPDDAKWVDALLRKKKRR